MEDTIKILGARVHNLKNVDLEIPRRKLVVVTGLSGSGKSSLAFDTIYAEGQRRYMETLSTYARQFVGTMERPDVDKITGLSPVVAIEQKTTNKNPRSTVGTVTEINDFLRLLYARASRAYSPVTGEEMVHYTDDQIAELILTGFAGRKIALMAPIVKGRKGHYRELFESLAKKGYIYARIDGEIREISSGMRLDRYKIHTIDLVVDRLVVSEESRERLMTSLKESMRQGKGTMAVHDYGTGQQRFYSRHLMCPSTGVAFEDPAPHTFSFNSPKGACPHCNGLGEEAVFDVGKIIPDARLSLREGAVGPLGKYRNNMLFAILEMLGRRYDFTLDDPVESFSEEALNAVLYGDSEPLTVDLQEFSSSGGRQFLSWEGVAEYIGRTEDDDSKHGQKWRDQFLVYRKCSVCGGSRLRKESLQFRVAGKNIAEVSAMSISEFSEWVPTIEKQLSEKEWKIAQEIVKEIRERLRFLMDVGLGYLSLARSSRSLSGGESQRIRLATQIGSKLVNVLYILDEPSIGLHQRDNQRLIRSLEELRDAGNSVIVVEHDEDMMRAADFIVDVGPGAGVHGGEIIAAGTVDDIIAAPRSITGQYLSGAKKIPLPEKRREGNGKSLKIFGAAENNLRHIDVEFPLGTFTVVTGVSGSGKSMMAKQEIGFVGLNTDHDIIVVDPEREYGPLIRALGGEVITISASNGSYVNALDISKEYGDGRNPLVLKSEFIMSLCEQLMGAGEIGAKEKSIIDRCTANIYRKYIRKYEGDPPTLKDLYDDLMRQKEPVAHEIALALELFTTGSLNVFAHQTNIDTRNRIICYDIQDLGENLKPIGLLVMLDAIYNRVIQNRREGKYTHVYIDEIYLFFANGSGSGHSITNYSSEFLYKCWKRFRKYGATLTGITQNVEECLLSNTARMMFANSEFLLMLNQAATDREQLAHLLGASDTQMSYVDNAPAGHGLIKVGGAIVPFANELPKNTELYRLMSTRPGEE